MPSSLPLLPSDGLASRSGADSVSISVSGYAAESELADLRAGVGRLKALSLAVGDEARENASLAESLEATLDEARAALKAGAKRLERAFRRGKSRHMIYLALFCVAVAFGLYVAAKARGVVKGVARLAGG